jgi:hypothetical protein
MLTAPSHSLPPTKPDVKAMEMKDGKSGKKPALKIWGFHKQNLRCHSTKSHGLVNARDQKMKEREGLDGKGWRDRGMIVIFTWPVWKMCCRDDG